MSKYKIGNLEAIMLVLIIVVTHTISSLPRQLLVSTKSATILNLIYVSIIATLLAFLIFKLFKKFPGQDIIDISFFVGGKVFRNIVHKDLYHFSLYFLHLSKIIYVYQINQLYNNYHPYEIV